MPTDNSFAMNDSGEASVSSSDNQALLPKQTTKKKRNLPGMPDPDAEVIALSPEALLATNRFVCEICNKGFQRDQNLQLHRRGHNLPWKLRQRSSTEVKKRVYVCPEPTCVHHDASRALGDLTGIKKHFCRKHGEKKWKCDKCSKKYAVQSDLKAHSKICGTKEYKCDCGTLFSRRDSFITHRAFCEVLAEESAKAQDVVAPISEAPKPASPSQPLPLSLSPPPSPLDLAPPSPPQPSAAPQPPPPVVPPASTVISSTSSVKTPELLECTNENANGFMGPTQVVEETTVVTTSFAGSSHVSGSVFASLFASANAPATLHSQTPVGRNDNAFTDMFVTPMVVPEPPAPSTEPVSLCLAMSHGFGQDRRQYAPLSAATQPAMSATALLQKAAQMGASATGSSLLMGLDIVSASSNGPRGEFRGRQFLDTDCGFGLGLGLQCDGGSGLKELMLGTPSVFGPKYPTLDLLGLGMAVSGGTTSTGLSALVTSIGGGGGNVDMAAAAGSFGSGDARNSDERDTFL
ncbi:unnamed protein product [Cuscuta campestris]|uniref:C2H2-type domain-containing protein n=1 Tax=Cuscuta campestris TaxID=132261 RepID=A0A484MWR5_9ASTE|nr:unnamed protein product [Cuscuta campestris]